MRIEDRFHNRLNELIDVGHLVLRTRSAPPVLLDADDIVDSELAMLWATDSQSLLLMIFGETNAHYKNFVKCMDGSIGYSDALQAQRVLITAAKELDSGCLVAARKLIEAEILGDFMSQTERLIADGYFQAAAVVAGSVLENSVRILCNRNSIQLSKRPKLGKMIDDLAKTGIYTELQMKRITTLADLSEEAAHGEWSSFKQEDVEEMVEVVEGIIDDLCDSIAST